MDIIQLVDSLLLKKIAYYSLRRYVGGNTLTVFTVVLLKLEEINLPPIL